MVEWSIRQLSADDAIAYRAVRHEALVNHPEAYGSSAESFAALSDDDLGQTLSRMTFFGVFAEGSLGGIVAFGQTQGEREQHRGWLYQVYVQPRLRGTGAALALIETAVEHARSRVLQIHLGVGAHNHPAVRLDRRAGFTIYGTEPLALFVNGRYVDEHLMVRFLDEAPGKKQSDE
ncbi:MAG: GNAT family N-acetyltransferase [Cypionkella sp.]